jgi:hypothetical protein
VWQDWTHFSPHVRPDGLVCFHDARAGRPDGDGLPGPTAVVERLFSGGAPGWEVAEEVDRVVVARRVPAG